MNTWFEVKVKFEKTLENGMNKKVTEQYLFDALSFTEAEAKAIEEITPFISGELTVSAIKKSRYNEVVSSLEAAADKWFSCKLNFITLDEKSGKEKKTASYTLVQASSVEDAHDKLVGSMQGVLADYTIEKIDETPIMDVYRHE